MGLCIYVSPHYDLYGAEKSMLSIISEMKSRGNKVLVILPKRGKLCDVLESERIEYKVLRFASNVNYLYRERKAYGAAKLLLNFVQCVRLKMALHGEKVDFVHTNSIVTDFGAQLSRVLKCRHYQHIRELGKKDFNMTFELGNGVLQKLHDKDEVIICISEAVKREYAEILKSSENCLVVVYNGVPDHVNNATREKKTGDEAFRMLMVGRLSEEKGQLDAVRMVNELRCLGYDTCLDLYGDGVDRAKIEKYISDYGLNGNVHLMGYSSNIDYGIYDAALMCSKCEAFGRVTVEYMLNRLPVVGTNSGGTPEIIEDGITGYVYEPADYNDLSLKVKNLIDNKDKLQQMGELGRQRALKLFSEDRYTNSVIEIYNRGNR